MKSTATTVKDYLASLPEDRRIALEAVRKVILANLDKTFEETMLYGVVAYVVPHSGKGGWPPGHHTNPKLPLMYMGFSSQKNDMVVYMLMLLHNTTERARFEAAWQATGRKNYLEVTGMGCCLRFKKLEDLSLDVIAQTMRRISAKKYLEDHAAMLASRGLGADGKKVKGGGAGAVKNVAKKKTGKKAAAKVGKKVGKKKAMR